MRGHVWQVRKSTQHLRSFPPARDPRRRAPRWRSIPSLAARPGYRTGVSSPRKPRLVRTRGRIDRQERRTRGGTYTCAVYCGMLRTDDDARDSVDSEAGWAREACERAGNAAPGLIGGISTAPPGDASTPATAPAPAPAPTASPPRPFRPTPQAASLFHLSFHVPA